MSPITRNGTWDRRTPRGTQACAISRKGGWSCQAASACIHYGVYRTLRRRADSGFQRGPKSSMRSCRNSARSWRSLKPNRRPHALESRSPGRQIEQDAGELRLIGFPRAGPGLDGDQARETTPVNSRPCRRTEEQIETVFGVANLPDVPEIPFDFRIVVSWVPRDNERSWRALDRMAGKLT